MVESIKAQLCRADDALLHLRTLGTLSSAVSTTQIHSKPDWQKSGLLMVTLAESGLQALDEIYEMLANNSEFESAEKIKNERIP